MANTSSDKLARNEVDFRRENEQADAALGTLLGNDTAISFRCECSEQNCNERIRLTSKKFQKLHNSPRRFVIKPGHATTNIDKVIAKTKDYHVIEKHIRPSEKK